MADQIRLTFLGTSSAQPTLTRNHSSLAVQVGHALWLFDCGEATQIQLQRANAGLRLSRLKRLFITHMHGDHIFGIGGLMCTLASTIDRPDFCLHLYGPAGLRQFVRTTLRLSYSTLTYKYAVHELVVERHDDEAERHPDEVAGDSILPDADGVWRLVHANGVSVSATFIAHRVPTLGFVLLEDETPGRLQIEAIRPILERHRASFADRLGIRNPLALLAAFKTGTPITLPDGDVLQPESFVDGSRPGRKIVILGDTNDPSAIATIAQDADVLVHEATNAYLSQDAATTNAEDVRQLCVSHGHSTPQMAGQFARRIRARRLILNHFSSRYRGDDATESRAIMDEIRQLAVGAFGCDRVVTAVDLLSVDVLRSEKTVQWTAPEE